ncbi:MAG: tRNA pseudouridine(38-40) synthase TruA [Planctomycetes bacterium]|nr:tRNA pseudouridine(38-40) synthase TruA [Planctomycetota bacterium]
MFQSRNIKLVIAYDGTNYHGWQRQAEGFDSVQARIEDVLVRVLGHPLAINGAGRTDAGVHAQGQVANFRTPNMSIPLAGLRMAVNSRLPADILVRSVVAVPDDFHASRSAVGKTYSYQIHVAPDRRTDLAGRIYRYNRPLDIEPMRLAAMRLAGEHDFRGFASSAEQRQDTVRTIFRCEAAELDDRIAITVKGDGFLYNMVRNIVGALVEIGRGHWGPDRIDKIFASRDRSDAGPTAPPDGLTLVCVHYDRRELV